MAAAGGRVSVLVVTYQGAEYVAPLAAALGAQSLQDFELVVVDNASTDGTAQAWEQHWPSAKVIRSPANLGFCGGNNLAARNARGEYLILLNQDTEVRPDWLERLVEALEDDPSAGIAQSKVLLHRDPGLINSVGCGFNYLLFGWAIKNGEPDDVDGPPFEVPYCQGASLAIRRRLFEELGGFNETFWMYHDDLELSLKARLAGHRCLCVPASVVLHKYNEVSPPHKLYLLERNRQLMQWKYYRRSTRLVLWPVNLAMDTGIFLLAIPQRWWREKLRAHRDARRMRHAVRGPDPKHPYRDGDLLRLLGADFQAGNVAPSFPQKVARGLLRAYFRVATAIVR